MARKKPAQESPRSRDDALAMANDDLMNVLASVGMGIVMLGRDLRVRRITEPARKILGLDTSDAGPSLPEIARNMHVPDLDRMIGEVVETATTREREARIQDHWYLLRVRPYRAGDNSVEGAVLLIIDMDVVKRAHESLRESESRFETLAHSAPVLIWSNDLAGCRFVNRAYQEFVGESEEEVHRLGHEAFVHPADHAAYVEQYAGALEARERFEMRLRLRRADGAYRWMKVVGIPRVVAGHLDGYVGCMFDITDMADAEAALRELDRGKNEFLAVLAHELRNPLSGVRNAARLLADPRDEEAVEHARGVIDRQSAHMVRMVDDLLDVSRITYGKIRLQKQSVDLVPVVRTAIVSTGALRDGLDQSLEAQFPEGEVLVEGDGVRLDQIFTNLLANAAKFTRRGGKVRVIVERERRRENLGEAVVRIRDNGVGITPAMLPRIFDLFVQVDAPSERNRTGIGLGLTLAKRLVDLHGGTIEAHSAGDALGSEFVVRLPLLEADAHASGAPAAQQEAAPARKRVLIVEDNVDSGQSLKLLLSRAGQDVRIVEDGASAVPAALDFQPHLVVLDIGLPDMDGYVVARQLRDDPRTRAAFIIAATGYGRDEDRMRSRQAGIDEHMTKPVDVDALLRRLAGMRDAA